jgi:hypothetical protein
MEEKMKKRMGLLFIVAISMFGLMATGCQQVSPPIEVQKDGDISIILKGSTAFSAARGRATYGVRANGRVLTVRARNLINLSGQTLNVFLDTNLIGSLIIDPVLGDGTLVLRGPTAPFVNPGSIVEVKTSADVLVLNGMFP